MTRGQRLRNARIGAGYKTATAAAAALRIPYATYAGHENGSRGIKQRDFEFYARMFGVSAAWLAFGTQDPEVRLRMVDLFSPAFKAVEALEHRVLEIVPPFPVPDGAVAVTVPDQRFEPFYFKDEILVVREQATIDAVSHRTIFVLVGKSGELRKKVIIGKSLRFNNEKRLSDIQDVHGKVTLDVSIIWCGEIIGIISSV
jgi:hypothetical protein